MRSVRQRQQSSVYIYVGSSRPTDLPLAPATGGSETTCQSNPNDPSAPHPFLGLTLQVQAKPLHPPTRRL